MQIETNSKIPTFRTRAPMTSSSLESLTETVGSSASVLAKVGAIVTTFIGLLVGVQDGASLTEQAP